MTKYFLTSQIVDDLLMFDIGDDELKNAAVTRLQSLDEHVKYLRQRLDLAEKVIGELYLIQEETTR